MTGSIRTGNAGKDNTEAAAADLAALYALTRTTRGRVLDWLAGLPPELLVREHPDFTAPLLGIFDHAAGCYLGWVGGVGLEREVESERAGDLAGLRARFAQADALVAELLALPGPVDTPLEYRSRSGRVLRPTRRWLLLHPVTHEFHHKGQAFALARALGSPYSGEWADLALPPG